MHPRSRRESSRTDGPSRAGITTAIAGPVDLGQAPDVEQARRERRARVPGGDDRVGLAVADSAAREDERALRLGAHGLDGLLVHLDRLGRLDELEALRVEALRPEETGSTVSEAASSAPATISSGPLSPPMASTATRTVSVKGLRSRSSERLDLAPAIRLAGRAHAMRLLRLVADGALVDPRRFRRCVALRLSRRVEVCLRFGTAMAAAQYSRSRFPP